MQVQAESQFMTVISPDYEHGGMVIPGSLQTTLSKILKTMPLQKIQWAVLGSGRVPNAQSGRLEVYPHDAYPTEEVV